MLCIARKYTRIIVFALLRLVPTGDHCLVILMCGGGLNLRRKSICRRLIIRSNLCNLNAVKNIIENET